MGIPAAQGEVHAQAVALQGDGQGAEQQCGAAQDPENGKEQAGNGVEPVLADLQEQPSEEDGQQDGGKEQAIGAECDFLCHDGVEVMVWRVRSPRGRCWRAVRRS